MYELNTTEISFVSGGRSVFITQEWKDQRLVQSSLTISSIGALWALFVTVMNGASVMSIMGATTLGGIAGFGVGYGLQCYINRGYENNTWREFSDTVSVQFC